MAVPLTLNREQLAQIERLQAQKRGRRWPLPLKTIAARLGVDRSTIYRNLAARAHAAQ